MFASFRPLLRLVLCVVLMGLLAGCKASEQSGTAADQGEGGFGPATSRTSEPGPDLAAAAENVRTIQLYTGENERSLPVTSLESGDPLTLEFDLMGREGRPLSVYFQHADRTWRRDLSDSQILESFQDDRLVDYQSSRGTAVPYVHYVYRFPNDDIRFRLSGNYVLRVTERGRRDSVLFEQAFFVTEDAGQIQLGTESIVVPGQRRPSIRPVARYTPPTGIQGDPFGYSVCFVRNGRLPDARCEDRPQLARQPELQFELERDRAFAPVTADYELDLSTLRATNEIVRVERTTTPIRAVLDPDYARFSDNAPGAALNGQIVVRDASSNRIDPALSAEYVDTRFAFVPANERPYGSEVVVAGSFSGMDPDRGTRMEWVSARNQYEGTVLLKQGQYQYFYATSDPALAKEVGRTQLRSRSTYTAFVYYRDARRDTDRLLRVSGVSP